MESLNKQKIKWRKLKGLIFLMPVIVCLIGFNANAQEQEIKQLVLNVEKLSQLKSILSDMEKGYTILSQGYNQVKNISQGNFSLHETFLNGLLGVNPEIKKYQRVADIIADESSIVTEYRNAYSRLKSSGSFSISELNYLGNVYSTLTSQSLQNINALAMIITASKLRMSDDERLQAIDHIYLDTSDKLQFLRSFNRRTAILQLQRKKELNDTQSLQKLYSK